ncbi:hypothetical protein BP5796_01062 [Coleophoma crateriformis]|uniref:Xylanolytic transcriptional activator regulatory domain-containing protein n=1 Tax=Coleophoma crateriformis TaxID=565419 RepID=A0A3D8T9P2_9HELO|nr:hypothetical protein BP5796_01062 [Coleophoma crateriformis]
MQNRIDRLEGLVLSLMTNGAQSAGPAAAQAAISRSQSNADSAASSAFPQDGDREDDDDMIKEEDEEGDSDVDTVANSLGVLKVDADQGKSLYFGESHWHLLLSDISEVKNYFINHKKELENKYEKIESAKPSTSIRGPAFLFSNDRTATDVELRSEVPPKSAVDKLVTRYFNSYDPAVHLLHSPTFHKQLHNHWQDPSKTSVVWLGLLYSILCLAMQSYNKIGDEPLEWKGRTLELAAEYRSRTVQCLINSDYTKSSIYTIETLCFYLQGEYGAAWDAEVSIWVIVGMIVRLGMRMGYHRDPSNYPNVTPYQAEMRRRVWCFVRQMDTMFSFQLALPGMIRDSDCDTQLPRNIFEDEFGPESKSLPPARPSTEPTPVSYMIAKASIALEFGVILEEINAVSGKKVTSYDQILKHDNALRELKANMAPHLRLRPIEECLHDPATLLMQRFNLDILWQKSICVLHRKYIARARQNPRYAHSRRACVDAALEILHHQANLHREAEPGGRLRTMKWFISSLTKHDYLLAAMIVCLDLHYDSISESLPERPPTYDMYFWTPEQRAEMLKALETSQEIWKGSSETSMEAFKASRILGIMLEKLNNARQARQDGPTTSAEVFAQFDEENLKPEHSAAMTLGMLSGGLSPNSAAVFNNLGQSPGGTRYGNLDMTMNDASGSTGLTPNYGLDSTNPFSNFNSVASPFSIFNNAESGQGMMDMPANLNWEAWDSYIQNGNAVDPSFQFYPAGAEEDPLNRQLSNEGQGDGSFGNAFMGANTPGR